MSNGQDNLFLKRILSQLLPEVFYHPVWIHFSTNISSFSHDFVQSVLHALQREQTQGDPANKCQVIFLCAYLQSRLGDQTTALASLEHAWELAEEYGLQQIARCAAWGACAICARRGSYREAAVWLNRLQEKLKEKHEWVLRNILQLLKQNMESQVISQDEGELSDWLLRWGEWIDLPPTHLPENGYASQEASSTPTGMISHLTHYWTSFWDYIRYRTKKRQLPQQWLERSQVIGVNESQERSPVRELKTSQPSEEMLSLASDFFPENLQTQSEVSGRSTPLSQPNTIPVPVPQHSVPKEPSLPSLAVYCLGQFQVYQDEQLVENWLSRKALSVFKYLILEHPAPVVKEVLMDTFWPDSDLEAGRRNLHQAIYALRQILRGEQSEFHHIFFKNDCYSLNPAVDLWIDFKEFEKCIHAGRRLDQSGQPENAIEQYGTAEALYQGDFLEEDLYEDWPTVQRERLRNSYFSLVDRLTELYLQTGQYTAVIHLCHKVLAKDRCYESVHRMLMQCYLAQGQRHLAVRQYQACIRALREDLGIRPSQETVDLYHRIVPKRDI